MYVCSKNQHNAHSLHQCFKLIILFRHVSNIQVFILRKTCTCSFMVFIAHIKQILPSTGLLIWIYERNTIKLHVQFSWGWTLGCSKHVKDTTIKLKRYCKSVHYVGSNYIGISQCTGRKNVKLCMSPQIKRDDMIWNCSGLLLPGFPGKRLKKKALFYFQMSSLVT
jgi:hypothetical protein